MHVASVNPVELLLKASGQGAVLIVMVLGLQWALGRRLEPRWRHALWLLVMLRLALPLSFTSPASVFNWLDVSRFRGAALSQKNEVTEAAASGQVPIETGETVPMSKATKDQTAKLKMLVPILPLIWAAGAAIFALILLVNHYRFHKKVVGSRSLVDERALNFLEDCREKMGIRAPVALVESAAVQGPSLFGFLRPRLLLPPGFTRSFSDEELRFVFLHELGHVKRHDIPLGWLMAFLQIVHWFNPLVWLAFSRMRRDRELACDAVALGCAEPADTKPYGRTIIKLLENFGGPFRAPGLAGIVEDKNQMKERMVMIAQFEKPRRRFGVMPLAFAALALFTLTDAQPGNKSPMTANAAEPGGDAAGQPPKIVSTSPQIGATDVDPKLKEITVTFDRDMGRGMSWTGGGPQFPPTRANEKANWRNKRTCVLPVSLEPGHYYRVGINSQSYRNFKSQSGVPALPSAIYFTTSGASDELKVKTAAPEVVNFSPPNGAQDVSADVSEVRVTFNMAMGRGMSWCTGDDDHDFPKGREGKQPYWTGDKLTCVLPVSLKPGMTYRIHLNDAQFNNFQSDDGVPLVPVVYSFKTADTK